MLKHCVNFSESACKTVENIMIDILKTGRYHESGYKNIFDQLETVYEQTYATAEILKKELSEKETS